MDFNDNRASTESRGDNNSGTIREMIMEYLDERGARHAMVGYPYAVRAAEFLVTHPEARARRQLRAALEYVESEDEAKRGRKAIDRCIRTMIAQMNQESTVKELVFAIADTVSMRLARDPSQV